jgi:hypothetical protein
MNTTSFFLRGFVRHAMLMTACLALPAVAQSLIERQQTELHQQQLQWDKRRIPEGMQTDALRQATTRDSGAQALALNARNVDFYLTGDIGFHVDQLAATLEPVTAGEPVQFDDPRTFSIRVHHGEVLVPPKALAALFNEHIMAYSPRPLNDMRITTQDDTLSAQAGLKLWSWFPGIWLNASLAGPIALNDKNELVFTPQDIHLLGIPLGGLLRGLGIKLTWLLNVEREGANLVDSQLVLDHRKVFPPPALTGNVAAVRLSAAGLHLRFADNPAAKFVEPPEPSKSYLWIQSGDAKLFDVVAANANIMIVDEKKDEVLHFNLYDYRQQVIGGTLFMDGSGTIIARLPSYHRLAQQVAEKSR